MRRGTPGFNVATEGKDLLLVQREVYRMAFTRVRLPPAATSTRVAGAEDEMVSCEERVGGLEY